MKRIFALVALAALLSSCTKSADQSALGGRHPWTQPGILRVAIQQDVKNLNPLLSSNTSDGMIDRLMFEPLLSANPQGDPVPMLATVVPTMENGGVSNDGLTVTYHLDNRAKWSDGVPVTSKDVKWSWQALMSSQNNVISRHGYDYVKSIDTPDAYTVVVHLKQKFAPFVNTFFAESDQPYSIAPEHVLGKYPNINEVQFNSEPNVSDGPFRFAEWSRGDHITLTRNDNFFMGTPQLNRIEIRIVPDENTSVNLLKTHAIDWIFQSSIENYPALKNIPDTHIVWVNVNGYEQIQFNDARPLLTDVRVRRAIAYAVDKQRLVDTITYGQSKIATEDLPGWMWAFDPNVKSYPHDIPKAKALLEQAGYTMGPNGIMQRDGQQLILVLVSNNSNVTRRLVAVELQSMLKQAGIGIEIKYFPGQELFALASDGGILQLGKFDVNLAGWYSGIDPDDSSQLMCMNIPPGGYNYSRYCNPDMEAAQKVALTNYDRPTRKKAYFRIQELLARDVPTIYTWYEHMQEPISNDFKGFAPNPVIDSWNAWQWSI